MASARELGSHLSGTPSATESVGLEWERVIRDLEEQARIAFLAADVEALDRLWADTYVVNSPAELLQGKGRILALLQAGVIRHETFECDIEHVGRQGDTVIVMGRDHVTGPPAGDVRRRFSNVWQLQGGRWRSIARHAQRCVLPAGAP